MIEGFFQPRSVAIIGASQTRGKVGNAVLSNMLEGRYQGVIYPINPGAPSILGLKAYRSVLDVEGEIDLAVIVIPRDHVRPVLEECGRKAIRAAIIITAGFRELGPQGVIMEKELASRARELGVRLLGPNCLGLIDTRSRLNASFMPSMPHPGNIAFFSQSGALCVAIHDWALAQGIGFSKFISMGNKADVGEVEIMQYLAADESTRVILGYLEGVEDGQAFLKVAGEVSRAKPLIIAKSGTTAAGARAASSHTGALAGSENAFEAAFRRAGIIRAGSLRDLFNYATAFSSQPVPHGPGLGIVTNGGGPGIIATDACDKTGLKVASFQKETVDALRSHLPEASAVYNPVDVLGDAQADRYESALLAVAADPQVDSVLTILTPQAGIDIEAIAHTVARTAASSGKPFVTSFMGESHVAGALQVLREGKVPNYAFPEEAVRALDATYRYRLWTIRPQPAYRRFDDVNRVQVEAAVAASGGSQRLYFGELRAKEIVSAYGLHVPKSLLAETSQEAVRAADAIGYPVVMKVVSPDIQHKSDIGGVKLGIANAHDVERTFNDMIARVRKLVPGAMVLGVAVQEMVRGGKEVILGMSSDPQFGPMIMFGMGGIYVEVLKDVSFRIAPLSIQDADEMVREIRSYPLLAGVRGEKPVDLDALREALLRFSQLVTDFPQIVEGDINPLLVQETGEGAVVIDARFTVEED